MAKKTIIIENGMDGRLCVLEQVMRGALAFGYVISKQTKVYDSKKEASEMLATHPCRKGCKLYTLSKKQVTLLKELKHGYVFHLGDFLKIKSEEVRK